MRGCTQKLAERDAGPDAANDLFVAKLLAQAGKVHDLGCALRLTEGQFESLDVKLQEV